MGTVSFVITVCNARGTQERRFSGHGNSRFEDSELAEYSCDQTSFAMWTPIRF